MPEDRDRSTIPSWDGSARGWRRYIREVAWYVQSTAPHKRRHCAAILISKLTGPARLLAMSWPMTIFDQEDGTRLFLQRLAQSPLVRKSLPNAAAICQQYFSFKRSVGESIGNFLVRETLVHEEFVEAITRLYEEKQGVAQDQRDFGLPSPEADAGEWWYRGDSWYGDEEATGNAPGEGEGATVAGDEDATESPVHDHPRASAGSSPSHRSVPGNVQPEAEPPGPLDELSFADSFLLGVLRGWRLLQAAGLSPEEKRDILSTSKNSLEYEVIAAALQTLWDEQLLGHRHHPSSHHPYNAHHLEAQEEDHLYYQTSENDWWYDDGNWWYDDYYTDNWWDSEDWVHEGQEGLQATAEEPVDPEAQDKLREAQQAERVAESLAAEANRTWADAQRATQALRRDRGFGAQNPGAGAGPKCYACGGSHFLRDCPQRRPGSFNGYGKGKSKNYHAETDDLYHNFAGKGKSKGKGKGKKGMWLESQAMWNKGKGKTKGKSKDGNRSVNAYMAGEYFVGGLELKDSKEINSADSSSSPAAEVGLLDCGATASAAPEAVVQSLINAVLCHDKNARIDLDQSARPYFRFGNGKWGRAVCKVTLQSRASGSTRSFSLYTLPNPAEYYQSSFDKSALVPILIGMDFLGPNGVGMLIDFSTGLAMLSKESNPQVFQLCINQKGHYTMDIVHYLTNGQKCLEGQAHVVVRTTPTKETLDLSQQMLELWTAWIDLNVADHELHERELETSRNRLWMLYRESQRVSAAVFPQHPLQAPLREMAASTSAPPEIHDEMILAAANAAKKANNKNRAPSLDPTRRMRADTRDPRAAKAQWPCYGAHQPAPPQSNRHGQWVHCAICDYRLLYTPRKGSPANTTATTNGPTVKMMLSQLQPLMGDVRPTAQICKHMLDKITAEVVLNKAIVARKAEVASAGYPSTPSSTWDHVEVDPDAELIVSEMSLYVGKKVLAMSALMTTALTAMLVDLHMTGRDGLWEVSCGPHDWLTQAAEQHGLQPRRIDHRSGYDLYQKETWQGLRGLLRRRRPCKIWFSLSPARWCNWEAANYNTEELKVKLETGRRKERRALWEMNQFVKDALQWIPDLQIYFEWPHPSSGWRQAPMEDLANHMDSLGVPWLPCRLDGCNYGMKDTRGHFVKKQWLIRTTDERFHKSFRAKVCPGNHKHHNFNSDENLHSNGFYPWKMVQSIARHWRDEQAPSRHRQLLKLQVDGPDLCDGDDELQGQLLHEDLVLEEESPDLDSVPEVFAMPMSASNKIACEHVAREARARGLLELDQLQRVLLLLHESLSVRRSSYNEHSRGTIPNVNSFTFGAYSHGNFRGVTKLTDQHPELVRLLNAVLRHQLPREQWSTVMVTFNAKSAPHCDHHNLLTTNNILLGLGDFRGGGLWLRQEPPPGQPVVRRRMADGTMARGHVIDINHKVTIFDPRVMHATQSWNGFRIGISAFTTRLAMDLSEEQYQSLRQRGFPMPKQQAELHVLRESQEQEPRIPDPSSGQDGMIQSVSREQEPRIPDPSPGLCSYDACTTTFSGELQAQEIDPSVLRDVPQADLEAWKAKISKIHRAAGHPTNKNLARIVKDGGHEEWKVQVALHHRCPACEALKPGGTSSGNIPPATTTPMYRAWQAVTVDVAEWNIPGTKKKAKFALFMDMATKLRVVQPLLVYEVLAMQAESTDEVIQAFSERWLGVFPKPEVVIFDAAYSFASEKMHDFLSSINIAAHYIADKESWAHGVSEAGVQDMKRTATAIHMDSLEQHPFVTLQLTASALNATEYTAGYSSFQWAFGQNYNVSDEDVRTFASIPDDQRGEFARLVTQRQKAEEIALKSRSQRILTKLSNSTVRQPLRTFKEMDLVKIWRKLWPQEVHRGPRGGFKLSGRPHWIGPGRVVFHEILPQQSPEDDRRHIVWVLIGSRLYRCSVHSVRPVTEVEKFVYETSNQEDFSKWRSLADMLPKREYTDLLGEEPGEGESELPELPQRPDSSTQVAPTRRVSRKTTMVAVPPPAFPVEDSGGETTTGLNDQSSIKQPPETDVNDYDDSEAKRARKDENWVEILYKEAEMEAKFDLYDAMAETELFLRMEFDLQAPSSRRERRFLENNPQLYLVKKMKDAEVVLSKLPAHERPLFNRAKAKEVDSFVKNEAVRRCLNDQEVREAYETKRIVKARWVLTWKLVPPEDQEEAKQDAASNSQTVHTKDGTRKAKARIVLLGFQHPNLLDPSFKTASPVQSSLGRNLLYAMSAQHQWSLEGLDLATAFLQTQPTAADQKLWTSGVEELREALGVGSEAIMRILRNIYGSTTAPRGLWLDLHETLTKLGGEAVLGERCLWRWSSKERKDCSLGEHPLTIGAMGGHVDDFHRIGDGSEEWLRVKEAVNSAYKWGTVKSGSYRHAGTDVTTVKDKAGFDKILVNQDYYVETVQDVAIDPDRLRQDDVMTYKEIEACRTSLGVLQWVAIQSQPQICARCNLLLTDLVTSGTLATAREIQEVICELRREPFKLVFQKFPTVTHWSELVFVSMGDQAHNNRPKGDSTGGLITLIAGPECESGQVCPMNILAWRTWKLKRKSISSNDAEVQAVLEAEDNNFRARLLWSELHGAGHQLHAGPLRRDLVDNTEQQVMTVKGIVCTDSKGGYDAVELNESPLLGLSNMRSALQAFQLRGNLARTACLLRWVASDYDLADALTKKKAECRAGLIKFLRSGYWCIKYDPAFTSAKKAKKQGRSAVEDIDRQLYREYESSLTSFGASATGMFFLDFSDDWNSAGL
ncbi:GIP [Symbiodinium sp. CCMP2592]|nr:GIP [Symbiodinium sp. CCMP2592]